MTEKTETVIPKKKKPLWKIVLIFLLLYTVAKVLGGITGRQQARNEGYLTGNELKETYKKSHIEGCTKNGSSEFICSCTFDGLIERLGLDGYTEMGTIATEKGIDSPEAKKYIQISTEELLKCREKQQ